jgi:hypothetical protein
MNYAGSDLMDRPNVTLVKETEKIYYVNKFPIGVYIQHINGALFTNDEWLEKGYDSSVANGIAIIDDAAQFVMSKTTGMAAWSSDTTNNVEGLAALDSANAKIDYKGYSNTQLILKTDTSGAAYRCSNYTFPNKLKGYLPSAGELLIAYKYKATIDAIRSSLGLSAFPLRLWTSTQSSADDAYQQEWDSDGGISTQSKNHTSNSYCPFSILVQ